MRKYSRIPALVILALATAGAAAIVLTRPPAASVDELTQRIKSGNADGKTWFEYAELKRKSGNYTEAIRAYKNAIANSAPNLRGARLGLGLAYAVNPADSSGDAFFTHLNKELIPTDAKTALDVLDSPEGQTRKQNPQFDPTRQAAEQQAAD